MLLHLLAEAQRGVHHAALCDTERSRAQLRYQLVLLHVIARPVCRTPDHSDRHSFQVGVQLVRLPCLPVGFHRILQAQHVHDAVPELVSQAALERGVLHWHTPPWARLGGAPAVRRRQHCSCHQGHVTGGGRFFVSNAVFQPNQPQQHARARRAHGGEDVHEERVDDEGIHEDVEDGSEGEEHGLDDEGHLLTARRNEQIDGEVHNLHRLQ
mmetsp:Transcript_4325/g.10592  ORF Transcript_4325/g.10592 Transcript_4325/m.10592 type:complete len:211 (-) Transcript_4325:1161-1793(-)